MRRWVTWLRWMAAGLAAQEQAGCLRRLERVTSVAAAARASVLGAFTAGKGYAADADYGPRAWLIHKTGVTRGAAVSYTAWVRRAVAHPRVFAMLAAGEVSESFTRTVCVWTGRLPAGSRDAADGILMGAALSGHGAGDAPQEQPGDGGDGQPDGDGARVGLHAAIVDSGSSGSGLRR